MCRPLTATHVLAALASARGWTTGAGLPDEARAGRQVTAPAMHALTATRHALHLRPLVAGIDLLLISKSMKLLSPCPCTLMARLLRGMLSRPGRVHALQVLREFCDGKLVSFCLPPPARCAADVPGVSAPLPGAGDRRVPAADAPLESPPQEGDRSGTNGSGDATSAGSASAGGAQSEDQGAAQAATPDRDPGGGAAAAAAAATSAEQTASPAPGPAMQPDDEDISEADLALMQELQLGDGGPAGKPRRASHKFHGKGSRRRMAGLVSAH